MITSEQILRRVDSLPTLPAVATQLSALLADPRSTAEDFERVLRADPALTANLLRLANCAYFGLSGRVETVRRAVTVLGLARVHALAAGAAVARVLPARLPGYDIEAEDFWLHCVAVALLAERLARASGREAPHLTFTAGLLHDVGKLVVGAFLAREREQVAGRLSSGEVSLQEAERQALGIGHDEVGAALARAWRLPAEVGAAARWHHHPSSAPAEAPTLLIDLVHAADALAHALGLGADVGGLARAVEQEVQGRLGLTSACIQKAAAESLDDIQEMTRLFSLTPGGRP